MDYSKEISITHGDCIVELKKIEGKTVDLIVTDPPYNLLKDYGNNKDDLSFDEYLEFSREWLKECYRVLKDDGTIYIFMGMKYISYIYAILDRELKMEFNSWITWHYTQGIGKRKGFSPRHDDVLMFTKSKKFNFYLDNVRIPQKYYRSINNMRGANPGNVWQFSHVHYCQDGRQAHPTQKPEGLYERMILSSSKEGDLVMDPFLGSGTASRVSQILNRKFIGIEINKTFVESSKERLSEDFTGFDSIDQRLERVPNDLNNRDLRMEYVKNHIEWFLSHHQEAIEDFINNVIEKYSKKIDADELEYLKSLSKFKKSEGQLSLF